MQHIVEIQESIYCSTVVACTWGRPSEVVTQLILLLLTVFVKFSMGYSMVLHIANNTVGTKMGEQDLHGCQGLFSSWANDEKLGARCADGHFYRSWVCAQADLSWIGDQASNMYEYLSHWAYGPTDDFWSKGRVGPFFGYMALLIWVAIISKELRSIGRFSLLLCLPRPPKGWPSLTYDDERGTYRITSMGQGARLSVLLVVVCRVAVALSLGFSGCKFLSMTLSLPDFILNSVALGFVFDLDDLCFSIFATVEMHHIVRNMEPIYCRAEEDVMAPRMMQLAHYIMLLGVVGMTAAAWYLLLKPFFSDVVQAYQALCPCDAPVLCSADGVATGTLKLRDLMQQRGRQCISDEP